MNSSTTFLVTLFWYLICVLQIDVHNVSECLNLNNKKYISNGPVMSAHKTSNLVTRGFRHENIDQS